MGKLIEGISIKGRLSSEQIIYIENELFINKVVVLKKQDLTDDTLKGFIYSFGDPFVLNKDTPTLGSDHATDSLIVVGNQASGYKNPYLGFQEVLPHSDHQWLETPSSISALYAIEIGESSSPTKWFDMEQAYELLDNKTKREIENIKIITYNPFYRPFGSVASKYVNQLLDVPPGDTYPHPLVRTHPITGRKILYMNLAYEIEFENVSYTKGYQLYKKLYDHIYNLQCTYTHYWENNDVVIWDNRATLHYRPNFDERIKRVLKRATVAGEKPFKG